MIILELNESQELTILIYDFVKFNTRICNLIIIISATYCYMYARLLWTKKNLYRCSTETGTTDKRETEGTEWWTSREWERRERVRGGEGERGSVL